MRRLPHNLDLFSFICYLSDSTALLQSIILLCVGCVWRYVLYVYARMCVRSCCVHTNTSSSTGHLTHFSVWITMLRPIMGRWDNECWKKTTSSLSHVRVPTLPVDRASQGWRGSKSQLSPVPPPSYIYILTTQGPVKPLHTFSSPQLKVVPHQWHCFLYVF